MNLYDIQKSQYDEELLALAAGVHTEIDNVSKEDPKYKNQLINLNKIREISPITYKSSGKFQNILLILMVSILIVKFIHLLGIIWQQFYHYLYNLMIV